MNCLLTNLTQFSSETHHLNESNLPVNIFIGGRKQHYFLFLLSFLLLFVNLNITIEKNTTYMS